MQTKLNLLTDLNAIDPMIKLGKKIDKTVKPIDPSIERARRIAEFETLVFEECTHSTKVKLTLAEKAVKNQAYDNQIPCDYFLICIADYNLRLGQMSNQIYSNIAAEQIKKYGYHNEKSNMWFFKLKVSDAALVMKYVDYVFRISKGATELVVHKERTPGQAKAQSSTWTAVQCSAINKMPVLHEYFDEEKQYWTYKPM